jgi:hypothetical protein
MSEPLLFGHLRPFHQRAIDTGDGGATCQLHCSLELGMEDGKDLLHTNCAIDGQPPQNRTTNQHGTRPQSESLENVGATTDATIQVDLTAPGYRIDTLRQCFGGDLRDWRR